MHDGPRFTKPAEMGSAEERRQREVAAQIQRLLDLTPALQATFGKTWDPTGERQAKGQHADAESGCGEAAAQGTVWQVVGGTATGGVLVRAGKGVCTARKDKRLEVGSRVRELELEGDRLHYQLVTGAGPSSGWVSTKLKGLDLLLRVPAEATSVEPAELAAAGHAPGGNARVRDDVDRGTAEAELAAIPSLSTLLASLGPDELWMDREENRDSDHDAGAIPPLEEVLAIVDHDEEVSASRQQFFELATASTAVQRWSGALHREGLVLGRGPEFSFRAIRDQGSSVAQALLTQDPVPSSGGGLSAEPVQLPKSDLRSRLQAKGRR